MDLPKLEGCMNMVVVIDRLSKGVVTNRLNNLEANIVAKWFIWHYFPHYFLPFIIVLDRGI
jgi:hypothetical protein